MVCRNQKDISERLSAKNREKRVKEKKKIESNVERKKEKEEG